MSGSDLLSIGELAAMTGVAVSALRYYDEQGLVDPASRMGHRRHFDEAAIGRVNFVRRAQAAGFSLAEIKDVLASSGATGRETVARKIDELRQQQAELERTIAMLEAIEACGCEVVAQCPAIESQPNERV